MKPVRKCPKCDSGVLTDRVKRGIFVRYLLFWRPYKRYRCDSCRKKTYILVKEEDEQSDFTPSLN